MSLSRFAFVTDLHWGYERRGGHRVPLHDPRALDCTLSALADFKPDTLILGGDILDCGVISHHNHGKPGRVEGMRLLADADECRLAVIEPFKALGAKKQVFIVGNHEAWLTDLEEDIPGIEGMLDVKKLLGLEGFQVIPQGGHLNLGKLTFLHGDQLSGGEHVAKAAVISYERCVRFGHFHTAQTYTKTAAIDLKLGRTGIAVPCLCTKDPKYGEGRANRWVQGFQFGYFHEDGTFNDFTAMITNGRTVVNGKVYRG